MVNVLLLGLVSLLTDVSSEMVYPLLPLYLTTRLGASPAVVGLIEGIAESLASLFKVFSGYFSDRIQRRKPWAIGGYASSTVGKALFMLSASWSWILAGRVIDRFGKGLRTAPRDALIAESSTLEFRGTAFGLHRMLDTLGAVVGVLLAYYFLTSFRGDYRPVFMFALVPASLGVLLLFAVRERVARKEDTARTEARTLNFRWSVLDSRLKAFLVVVFLFTLGNSSNQFLLLRAQNMGFSPASVILLYLTYNIVYAAVSYPAGRLSDRIGRKALLVFGYLVYGLVYFGFALARQPGSIWLLFGAYGLFAGATEGVEKALLVDIAPPGQKATVIGLHATLVGIGLLPASLIAGLLWSYLGSSAPFYLGGVLGIAAALGLWVVLKTVSPAGSPEEGARTS
ncbi:MFS transporter permease [Clostridiales bacterium PH28_bin88]|nr:MFS transporter permease [Clostridiales bacterium PH28_bin88]